MKLQGKMAIITGAASGIGRAAAILFAQEGCRVVVSDINGEGGRETVASIHQAGREALFVETDVSDSAAVQAMVRETLRTYGQLHILYNNAAIAPLGQDGMLTNIAEEDWERIIRVNLGSVYLCCKYAIPHMILAGGGAIINTSSVVALMGHIGQDAYTAAKGAIIALTRSLAVEYAPQGIRVNVICPGVVRTGMTEVMWSEFVPKEILQGVEKCHLTRLGQPEDIARVALFLASDEAAFITGTVCTVDGGLTANACLNAVLRGVAQYA